MPSACSGPCGPSALGRGRLLRCGIGPARCLSSYGVWVSWPKGPELPASHPPVRASSPHCHRAWRPLCAVFVASSQSQAVGHAAIADEAWSELVAVSPDSKRKHIHWTYARTHEPSHVQPCDMTRQEVWAHLTRVYKDVYPEPAHKTGSILLFGGVAKELHASASEEGLREEHHHAPAYSSKHHMWKRIAQVSLEKYRVAMHAACHDGDSSMHEYVRKASPKKPLSELDAEFFMSEDHPRGSALQPAPGCRLAPAEASRELAQPPPPPEPVQT